MGTAGTSAPRRRREALLRAVSLHAEIDRLRAGLLERRACLDLPDRALYDLLRRGEFLWPQDHLAELRAAAARLGPSAVQRDLPLLATGYVPEPMALLDHLAELGAYVALGRPVAVVPDPQLVGALGAALSAAA